MISAKKITFFGFFFLFSVGHAFAQSPFLLEHGKVYWALDQHIEILPEPIGNLSFQEMIEAYHDAFVPIQTIPDPQSLKNDYLWLKITFLNQVESSRFILTLDNWDEARVYYHDSLGTLQMHRTGYTLPLDEREVHLGRFLHLPLDLHHQKATVLYVRCAQTTPSTKGMNTTFNYLKRLELKTLETAEKGYFIRSIFYSFNMGILLIIIIYKLMLFMYIRDITYLYFVLFLSLLLVTVGFESGYLEYILLNDSPQRSIQYYGNSLTLSFVFLLLFARSYLRLPELLPRLNRYILFLIGFQVFIFLLSFFNIIGIGISILAFIFVIFSALYISIRSVLTGFKPARYFLLADSMYLIALFLNIFTSTGLIPYDYFIEPFNIGNLLQITMFSLGLAYRFKVMQLEVKTHQEEKQQMIEQQKEQLELEVRRQTEHIQSQSEEIQVQNEELFQQREEIAAQRDFVESKNKELENINTRLIQNESTLKESYRKLQDTQDKISLKNRELEERDRQIRSSINAALSIQTAILPYQQRVREMLNEHFIIYRPKDIVSGDFYWLNFVGKHKVVVTADCTGHGVPGALMSMIGNTIMDKVISMQQRTNPTEILEEIHKEVRFALKQDETENINGMDMSVLVLEEYGKGLTLAKFAGAKSAMYFKYPNEAEVTALKGSRRAIGGIQNLSVPFETREVIFNPGTMIYMGSDGYVDQNNAKRKRFGETRLKKLLAEIAPCPSEKQKQLLIKTLKAHMHGTQQRDDILLLGFRL